MYERNKLKDPGSLLLLIYIGAILFFLLLGTLSQAFAITATESDEPIKLDDVQRGELLVAGDKPGFYSKTPILSQEFDIDISGMVAHCRISQIFTNTSSEWIEAVYVFPLPDESSINMMKMKVGERIISGEIKEKESAKRLYEKAKSEGRKTSLLAQKRPNIFTMAVANIPPGEKIEVQIEYVDSVRLQDDLYSYRLPLVVGPRYIPGKNLASEKRTFSFDSGGWAKDTDQVPDASQITPHVNRPEDPPINAVELSLSFFPGFDVRGLTSLYHGVTITSDDESHYRLVFNGEVYADRDFVLEYRAKKDVDTTAALFSEKSGDHKYLYLLFMPPDPSVIKDIPRDITFVLDVSGSMAGDSIRQAKSALEFGIERLGSSDRFSIITFNNNASRLFPGLTQGTERNKQLAIKKIRELNADGGTEMMDALKLAFADTTDGRSSTGRIQQIIFLTDGAVGNEHHLFDLINEKLGDARLFTIGIGSAPNSFFMSRAASMGRGTYSFIGDIREVRRVMTDLLTKLESPALTGIELHGEGDEEMEIYPSPLPDLYSGEPLVAFVRAPKDIGKLSVTGSSNGYPWEIEMDAASVHNQAGIGVMWARKKIRSLMDSLHLGAAESEVKRRVLETALDHQIVSKYTSLVAVDQHISKNTGSGPEKNAHHQIKTNIPKGWSHNKIFGTSSQTGTQADFHFYLGVFLLLAALLLYSSRRMHRI